MLNFIFGLPSSGKTQTVLEKIKADVSNNKQVVIFVPEQFSFNTERTVLKVFDESNPENISVLTFSRLYDILANEFGGIFGKTLSDTDKIIIMTRVLTSVKCELLVWGKYYNSLNFAKTVLDTIGELKVNAITAIDIKKAAETTTKITLKNKLLDIALIYETFDAFLGEKFIDPVDKLTKVYKNLENSFFFKGKTVYFDSFKAFTGQQFKIIDRILSQADDVTFAMNYNTQNKSEFDIFTILRKNISKIENLAKKNNVKIMPPVFLDKSHYKNEKLQLLERLIANDNVSGDLSDTITICKAESAFDEVEFAFRTIRRLVREENYRFKDFVIIARDTDKYLQAVEYISKKNDVSCFFDKRITLNSLPFCFAINSAIDALDFSSEDILRFHKCGFSTLTVDEISKLENYTFLWNINKDKWLQEWDMNPNGFNIDTLTDEDLDELKEINKLRENAIKPIIAFKDKFYGNAKQMCSAIIRLLDDSEAENTLKTLCERFDNIDGEITADVLKQGYDSFIGVLDGLVTCFGDKKISVLEFKNALNLALSTETVGVIPQFIDEVSFGSADRIQPARPKIAFILGANQGVFPKGVTNSGVWALNERKKLIEMGIELSDNSLYSAIDEDYLVYSNLCCASERVYITYATQNTNGEELMPSPFVNSIVKFLNPTLTNEPNDLNNSLPETNSAVFAEICRRFGNKNDLVTLNAALQNNNTLEDLNSVVNKDLNFIKPENAQKLFGDVINLSATKIDTVNRCRFSYFCKYGLRAEKLQSAEFNVLQRGNIAHYVLERLITDFKENIANLNEAELHELTDKYIEEYLGKISGFSQLRDAKIEFLIGRISRSLKDVVCHIAKEFKQSSFKPVACEFKIGFNDGLQLEFPYDNGKIKINGSIDRVDEYNGFIRIVDYKTGSKTFKLPDIVYGLNMQMLIYLYALIRGQGIDDEKAAAILYMPAKRDVKDEGLAMNGLLKADINLSMAMEKANQGEFVPKLPIKKDGTIGKRSSFIANDGFTEIFNHIENIMRKTGNLISNGDISVSPIDGRESPACKYCDFKTVCFVDDAKILKVPELSNEKVFEALKEAESNGI